MPSSIHYMANITVLFLDRYRSSTGLPALVPGVFPSSFLPLPYVQFSPLSFPTPASQARYHLWFVSLLSCTSAAWFSGTVCVFPPKGSVAFSSAFSSNLLFFLASELLFCGSPASLSPTSDKVCPRLFTVGFTAPIFWIGFCGPREVPKPSHTTPPERQGQQGKG